MSELLNMPRTELTTWLDGFTAGRIEGLREGFERGYKACDDEISTLQRTAASIVHAMADTPIRDQAEDARQAAKRSAFWSARRGDVA